eukprot:TRINITY_DN4946_c0_g2_i2.p2 TRINITY_DN4946_c0_g2~~TRINITY_DN4946_c0_g2_i2.p2  ORF type:complete len:205 (-),score=36.70 TRINITY_DN4946_c0_g2_i2:723-1337(-)
MAPGRFSSSACKGIFLLLVVSLFSSASAVTPLTKAVNWRRPQVLTRHFLERNTKPILYVIHKSWCPACEFMRNEFAGQQATDEFVRISKDFVMIEAMDDDEPQGVQYGPDGGYYPRAVLMDPSGTVRPEYLPNKDPTSEFKYTFYFPPQMVEVMKEILSDVASGAFSSVQQRTEEEGLRHFPGNRGAMKGPYNRNRGYSGDGSY